ncbi:MAG: hypothetical protein GY940_35905 [bacterium]|nr:hypothetical protein [bacterium]
MRQILEVPATDILPEPAEVFQMQGIPGGHEPSERVRNLYQSAEELFLQLVEPRGIMEDITVEEFHDIYTGIGENEPETPLELIFPTACHLALLAFTLGPVLCDKIKELMQPRNRGFALGYMVDCIASRSAEKASEVAEGIFLKEVSSRNGGSGADNDGTLKALLYSPGYCGWHVSGQGKLFHRLKPEKVGMTISSNFFMTPVKSISGLLVAGPPEIHRYDNSFAFCGLCVNHNCRERIDRSTQV